ncbi:MAG: HNH endonuclease [Pseudobutyrivibrio sp.]|nr:HNH endonuclease [Pseudobutyrivibrio sp.]
MDIDRYFQYIKENHPGTPLFIKEEWRPLTHPAVMPGRYESSSYGDIREIATKKPVVIKDASGYKQAYLHDPMNRFLSIRAHILIAWDWVPNPDPARFTTVNHIDGDKTNNVYTNLEWTDLSGNSKHAAFIGLSKRGPGKSEVYISDEDVRYVCKSLEDSKTYPEMIAYLVKKYPDHDAEDFRGFISNVQRGKTFTRISKDYDIARKHRNAIMNRDEIKLLGSMLEKGTTIEELKPLFFEKSNSRDDHMFRQYISDVVRRVRYKDILADYNLKYPEGISPRVKHFDYFHTLAIRSYIESGWSDDQILTELFGNQYQSMFSEKELKAKLNAIKFIRKKMKHENK